MKYTPKYKTPDWLLKELGYNEPSNRGYRKVMTKKNIRRKNSGKLYNSMHALTSLGEINLHYDKAKTPTIHESFKRHCLVVEEMKKIIDLDMSFAPIVPRFIYRFKKLFK
jgi:hypothetical protein